MGSEYEPAIFKRNPEYKNWKKESEGSSPYFPLQRQQESPILGGFDERRLERYEELTAGPWEAATRNWATEKARVVEMLRCFPSEAVIPQVVVKADDKRALRKAMLSLLEEDENCLGVRTCYSPDRLGKAPYSMGKIKDRKAVDRFLENDYQSWLQNERHGEHGEHFEEIIVLANPPLLGTPETEDEHFVFIAKIDPGRFLTEVALDTSQLRTIENANKDSLIEIERFSAPGTPLRRGATETSIGQDYWNGHLASEVVALVMDVVRPMRKKFNGIARLIGLTGSDLTLSNYQAISTEGPVLYTEWGDEDNEDGERVETELEYTHRKFTEAVKNQAGFSLVAKEIALHIFDPNYILDGHLPTNATISGKISTTIAKGTLPEDLCKKLVKPRAWTATENLRRLVYDEWLHPPMDIYLRLMALNNVCVLPGQNAGEGYDGVEVQGGYNTDGQIEYAKIYAIRGREEKEFAQRSDREFRSRSTFTPRH